MYCAGSAWWAGHMAQPAGAPAGAKLTREDVSLAVWRYGDAWTRQDPVAIAAIFTEDGLYVERVDNDVGTFAGREEIDKYWRRQILSKQSGIAFEHVVDDMILDSEGSIAMVKWVASFDNKHTVTREESRVEFTQIAMLTFTLGTGPDGNPAWLVSRLEEYWHSPNTDKRPKCFVFPKAEKQRNRSRNLHAAANRVKAMGIKVPSMADYAMQ